jgi:hypothetical protein
VCSIWIWLRQLHLKLAQLLLRLSERGLFTNNGHLVGSPCFLGECDCKQNDQYHRPVHFNMFITTPHSNTRTDDHFRSMNSQSSSVIVWPARSLLNPSSLSPSRLM